MERIQVYFEKQIIYVRFHQRRLTLISIQFIFYLFLVQRITKMKLNRD